MTQRLERGVSRLDRSTRLAPLEKFGGSTFDREAHTAFCHDQPPAVYVPPEFRPPSDLEADSGQVGSSLIGRLKS